MLHPLKRRHSIASYASRTEEIFFLTPLTPAGNFPYLATFVIEYCASAEQLFLPVFPSWNEAGLAILFGHLWKEPA
jgi:hypothetical protein